MLVKILMRLVMNGLYKRIQQKLKCKNQIKKKTVIFWKAVVFSSILETLQAGKIRAFGRSNKVHIFATAWAAKTNPKI